MLAGLAPALAARRADLSPACSDSGRSGAAAHARTTRCWWPAQVALAVTLLVVAGLATRTLIALEQLEPGFDIDNVLTASVTLPDSALPPDGGAAWIEQALDRARRLPGVVAAGATSRLPFAGSRFNPNRGLEIEGPVGRDSGGSLGGRLRGHARAASNRSRVRLVEGRSFTRRRRRRRAARGGRQPGDGAALLADARRSARGCVKATNRSGSGAPSSASSPTSATTTPISRRCRISMCRWRSSRCAR